MSLPLLFSHPLLPSLLSPLQLSLAFYFSIYLYFRSNFHFHHNFHFHCFFTLSLTFLLTTFTYAYVTFDFILTFTFTITLTSTSTFPGIPSAVYIGGIQGNLCGHVFHRVSTVQNPERIKEILSRIRGPSTLHVIFFTSPALFLLISESASPSWSDVARNQNE